MSELGLPLGGVCAGRPDFFGPGDSPYFHSFNTGMGRDIDVSLFDVALHNLSYLATWYLATGDVQKRLPRSAHPCITPSQLYPAVDGWIFIN